MSKLFTVRERYYALPYQLIKPERVLVLVPPPYPPPVWSLMGCLA